MLLASEDIKQKQNTLGACIWLQMENDGDIEACLVSLFFFFFLLLHLFLFVDVVVLVFVALCF